MKKSAMTSTRTLDPVKKDGKYVWLYHRLDADNIDRFSFDKKIIDYLEDKLDTEGLELVMGTPQMEKWLFRWVR